MAVYGFHSQSASARKLLSVKIVEIQSSAAMTVANRTAGIELRIVRLQPTCAVATKIMTFTFYSASPSARYNTQDVGRSAILKLDGVVINSPVYNSVVNAYLMLPRRQN